MNRVPPHDLQAEAAVLGTVLVSPRVVDEVAVHLTPADFYRPAHQATYAAMLKLRSAGEPIDIVSVASEADAGLVGVDDLMQIQATVGSIGAVQRHVRTVIDHALRRQALLVAADIAEAAYGGRDVDELIRVAQGRTQDLIRPTPDVPPTDLADLADFLDRPREEIPGGEWAVPGLLRRTWRALFVAGEGVGKTTMLRQLAILAAQGVHPFAFSAIPPVRTLMVDTENPAEVIDHQSNLIVPHLHELHRGWCWLWSRPQGIDIRSRSGRAELEAAVAHVRPSLVCIGPVYKIYRQQASENYELVAMEVQQVLDDLRTRYQFALVLEHHAPGASAGSRRELKPKGSAVWLAWPEFGITLKPIDVSDGKVQSLELARYRFDRIPAAWPKKLTRGTKWPWEGVWDNGTFTDDDQGGPF